MKSIGKYRVVEDLGCGATGQTYRTRDPFRNREFAIKILKDVPDLNAQAKEQFCGYLTLCADLTHRHIGKVQDLGEIDGAIFWATDWRTGVDLRQFMPAQHDLPLDQKLALIAQIAEGLAFAHSRGVAHGNLKPSNIFVDSARDITILDFGTANWLGILLKAGNRSEGLVARYLAPEQILDQPFDARSDIFTLGLILYEFASGKYPFSSDAGVLPREIVHSEAQPLRQVDAHIPEALEELVSRALKKDPGQRLQTAEELASGLYLAAQQVRRGGSVAAAVAPSAEATTDSMPITQLPPALAPEPGVPPPQAAIPMNLESPAVPQMAAVPAPVRKRPQDTEQAPQPWTQRSYATTNNREVLPARPAPPNASIGDAKQPEPPPFDPPSPAPPKAPVFEPPQSFLMPALPPEPPRALQPPKSTMTRGVVIAGLGLILAAGIVTSLVSRQNLRASQTNSHAVARATEPAPPVVKPIRPAAAPVEETLPRRPAEAAAKDLPNPELSAKQTLNGPVRWLWENGHYAKALALVDQVLAEDPANDQAIAWKKKIREAQAAEAALK